MDFIYQPFLEGMETWENDLNGYLSNYFITDGAFGTTFIIAVFVALIMLAVFYGLFGMIYDKLATPVVYWVTCGVTFLITWITTQMIIWGSNAGLTGVYANMDAYKSELQTNCGTDQACVQTLHETTADLIDTLSEGCDVTLGLDVMNSIIAVVIFLIVSLIVKRLTRYARAIPF